MHDKYAQYMSANSTESTRVDQQFEMLTQNFGYRIHPSIRATLPANPTVADIGTGTGCCLVRLAAEMPRARLHGFDISPALFPDKLPDNVKLHTLDAKQPFPAQLHGAFDLVHARLLAPSMTNDDWIVVLRNVTALLRPGGAIQWAEPNWSTTEHLRGREGSTCSAARELGDVFREAMRDRYLHGWSDLPRLMREIGLERVERDIISTDRLPETRWALSVNNMVAMCLFADIMIKQGVLSYTEEEMEALGNQGFVDIDSGCYLRYDFHVAVGFRSKTNS